MDLPNMTLKHRKKSHKNSKYFNFPNIKIINLLF